MAWNAGDKIGAFIRYRLAAEMGVYLNPKP